MAITKTLYNNQYISLYTEDNITIWAKMAIYNSIFNEEYEIITDVVITQDTKDNVIYKTSNIHIAYNKEGSISISNYVEKIVKYLLTTTSDTYWQKIFLDKFFIESKTTSLELTYKRILKQEEEQKSILQAKETRNKIEELKTEVQKYHNNKNNVVIYDLFNLVILKNDNKYNLVEKQNDKNFREFILNGIENNSNTIAEYVIKIIKLEWNKDDIKILNELLAS